jgi:hypothetical protein
MYISLSLFRRAWKTKRRVQLEFTRDIFSEDFLSFIHFFFLFILSFSFTLGGTRGFYREEKKTYKRRFWSLSSRLLPLCLSLLLFFFFFCFPLLTHTDQRRISFSFLFLLLGRVKRERWTEFAEDFCRDQRDEASLLQEKIREKKKEQDKSTCEARTNREREREPLLGIALSEFNPTAGTPSWAASLDECCVVKDPRRKKKRDVNVRGAVSFREAWTAGCIWVEPDPRLRMRHLALSCYDKAC